MKFFGRVPASLALAMFATLTMAGQNESNLVQDSIIPLDSDAGFVWDMSFAFKTMNVFRGLLPSRAPVLSTEAGFKAGSIVVGAYGGASFNGGYTETDLILMYYRPKFYIRADWYYNFTEGITNIPTPSGFFDFRPDITRGLLDFMIKVKPARNIELMSSTFLYGRDRPPLPEDEAAGIPLRRGEQRYSQYLKFQYNWVKENFKILLHAAYSFSWNDPSGETFYADNPGFTDIGVTFYRKIIDTKTVSIPFKASFYWNTVSNQVYLVGSILLIELTKL